MLEVEGECSKLRELVCGGLGGSRAELGVVWGNEMSSSVRLEHSVRGRAGGGQQEPVL